MRVTDRSTMRNFMKYMNKAKSNYAKTNEQIASEHRFERISDDVSAGTKVMRTRMDMYKAQKHLDNVGSVAEEIKTTEDTLMAVSELLGNAHSTALKAASQMDSSSSNTVLANEVKNLREHLLQLMNTKFGETYSFGGSNASLKAPFSVDANGKLLYNNIDVDSIKKDGDGYYYMDGAGDRQEIPMDEDVYMDVGLGIRMNASQIDGQTGLKINYSGLDAFGFGVNDEGLTNNVYNILKNIEDNIRTFDKDKITAADTQLKQITEKFQVNLADVGSKTKFIENMEDRLKSNVLNYETRITSLMGTDTAEAAMQQSTNESVLKAVLQIGSRVLPVSLMDFIR